jgi:hypothetical protein
MPLQLFFYLNLLLCVIVFIELLVTYKKKSLLKVYFLLIIASLFAMNYFAVTGVETRVGFMLVKLIRMVYVCSTLLAIIYLVHPKVPRWIIGTIILAVVIAVSFRVYYYDQIDIERLSKLPNQVFLVGTELYAPKPEVRYTVFALTMVVVLIAYYYYRLYLIRMNRDSANYKQQARWIISFVSPFFLLTTFNILGNLGILNPTVSSYLFALFSFMIIFSFLLRPGFGDKVSYSNMKAAN